MVDHENIDLSSACQPSARQRLAVVTVTLGWRSSWRWSGAVTGTRPILLVRVIRQWSSSTVTLILNPGVTSRVGSIFGWLKSPNLFPFSLGQDSWGTLTPCDLTWSIIGILHCGYMKTTHYLPAVNTQHGFRSLSICTRLWLYHNTSPALCNLPKLWPVSHNQLFSRDPHPGSNRKEHNLHLAWAR